MLADPFVFGTVSGRKQLLWLHLGWWGPAGIWRELRDRFSCVQDRLPFCAQRLLPSLPASADGLAGSCSDPFTSLEHAPVPHPQS